MSANNLKTRTDDSELYSWQLNEYTQMKPGLERIKVFLERAGNPQDSFKSVLIAGTNGKGSTAVMLAGILEKAGYKAGLYTSPHLTGITERVKINSRAISDAELEELCKDYLPQARKDKLTFFEFITALAFIYFKKKNVDIAVLEAGLGGRFDAVNIVKKPELSIITDIDYDHCEVLGKTIADIAKEKAGIIRKDVTLLTGCVKTEALKVFNRQKPKMYAYDSDFTSSGLKTNWSRQVSEFNYKGFGEKICIRLGLVGLAQPKNCSLAVSAALLLNKSGYLISIKDMKAALLKVKWPGRFEIRKNRLRTFIIDGAHNPAAIDNFARTFEKSPFCGTNHVFIFGMLKEKDHFRSVERLSGMAKNVILTEVNSPRKLGLGEMASTWSRFLKKDKINSASSIKEALKKAEVYETVVIVGSLYLAGEADKFIIN